MNCLPIVFAIVLVVLYCLFIYKKQPTSPGVDTGVLVLRLNDVGHGCQRASNMIDAVGSQYYQYVSEGFTMSDADGVTASNALATLASAKTGLESIITESNALVEGANSYPPGTSASDVLVYIETVKAKQVEFNNITTAVAAAIANVKVIIENQEYSTAMSELTTLLDAITTQLATINASIVTVDETITAYNSAFA